MIEGPGSGFVSLTSGSGSRRPKDPQHWINDYSYTVFGTLRDFLVSMSPSLMAGQRDSGTYIREHAEHFWPCATAKNIGAIARSGRRRWSLFQCCGSGSGIRCLFDPWIPDLGSRIPRPYFEELFENFLVKSSRILWKLAQIFFFNTSKLK